jgi:general secretion pathway protein J
MGTRIQHRKPNGFTLIEALLSLMLVSMILAALATVTSQWLPNWNRGMESLQRAERVATSLQRIVGDLSSAEMIPSQGDSKTVLFEGDQHSITFVRNSIGPNAKPGLEIVRLSEKIDGGNVTTIRERTPFLPMTTTNDVRFTDPVILVRAPYRITLSYAGEDGLWQQDWHGRTQLPSRIRVLIRNAATRQALGIVETTTIHITAPAECARADNPQECLLSRSEKTQ